MVLLHMRRPQRQTEQQQRHRQPSCCLGAHCVPLAVCGWLLQSSGCKWMRPGAYSVCTCWMGRLRCNRKNNKTSESSLGENLAVWIEDSDSVWVQKGNRCRILELILVHFIFNCLKNHSMRNSWQTNPNNWCFPLIKYAPEYSRQEPGSTRAQMDPVNTAVTKNLMVSRNELRYPAFCIADIDG